MAKPAIFLDRDGTINVEKNYLYRFGDWEWIPGARDAIKRINEMGFLAIVVTNQSGVARGFYTEDDVVRLHEKVNFDLMSFGAHIDKFYFCPHHANFGIIRDCDCRKPSPGMLLKAKNEFDIDMEASYLIGDKLIDIQAGLAARVNSKLVLTGYGKKESSGFSEKDTFSDILAAVENITNKIE